MNIRLIGLGAIALALASGVQAQALSVEEALRAAVTSHPLIAARQGELQGSSASLEAARWQRYPALSAQSTAAPAGGSVHTVRIDVPLWTGGRVTAEIDTAQARRLAAEAAVGEAQQTVMTRVATAFADLMRMREKIAAADENIAEHQRLLEMIERRVAAQYSPAAEATMARARLEQARTDRVQFENQLANAQADLAQLVGRPVDEVLPPPLVPPPAAPLPDVMASAVGHSPQVQRLKAEEKVAEAEIASRKSAWAPQVSVRHDRLWGRNYPDSATYLALTFQPGGGLSSLSNVQAAVARRGAAAYSSEAGVKDVTDRVRTDWNQGRSSASEAAVLRDLVQSTRGVYESFLRQFPAGRKSWQEVLNARREATQARYSLADATWIGFGAAVRVDILTGRLVERGLRLEAADPAPAPAVAPAAEQ